ncbi:PadR family transcriptional regulator [Pelagicoccus mobilis]|uniref:PadR family transcriptional regulator n=1 Tax=Pelagicoccus mobilis TaxID=415221 RepID=A0A934VRJ3_9BACT|nr:PadR family transcriptional regulator [Pelagicoccus mobilis]MBK1879457.1 PadR family transcriptional regulator [Pelagicoccus mobilis]
MPEDKFNIDNWATQARKGLLEYSILNSLVEGERYGYLLVKQLVGMDGLGVSEGTVYPLLSRLKRHGLVETRLEESSEGPARKYYSLTPLGREQLKLMTEYIGNLMEGIETLKKGGNENV